MTADRRKGNKMEKNYYTRTLTIQINEDMIRFAVSSGYALPGKGTIELSNYVGHVAEFIEDSFGNTLKIYGAGVACAVYGPLEKILHY